MEFVSGNLYKVKKGAILPLLEDTSGKRLFLRFGDVLMFLKKEVRSCGPIGYEEVILFLYKGEICLVMGYGVFITNKDLLLMVEEVC